MNKGRDKGSCSASKAAHSLGNMLLNILINGVIFNKFPNVVGQHAAKLQAPRTNRKATT